MAIPLGFTNRKELAEHHNCRKHQRIRYLVHRSDCYRLERPVAGWDWHPLEIAAFSQRTDFGHFGVGRTAPYHGFALAGTPRPLAQAASILTEGDW